MDPFAAVEIKTEQEQEQEEQMEAIPVLASETTESGDAEEGMDYAYDVENGGEAMMTQGPEIIEFEDYTTASTVNLDDNDDDHEGEGEDEAANDNDDEEEDDDDQLPPMASERMSLSVTTSNDASSTTNTHDGQQDDDDHHHHFGLIHHHQPEGLRGSARRVSLVTDLSTGKAGGARAQNVRVRSSSLAGPQTARKRLRNSILNRTMNLVNVGSDSTSQHGSQHGRHQRSFIQSEAGSSSKPELSRHGRYLVSQRRVSFGGGGGGSSSSDESDEADLENPASHPHHHHHRSPMPTQYCLRAVRQKDAKARIWAWLGISDSGNVDDDLSGSAVCSCFGLSPNTLVTRYLHWTFRSTFMAVFLSAVLAYLSLTMMFAVVLHLISLKHPTCMGGVGDSHKYFTDSFALSWSTFATVGYGIVYSGTSADESHIIKCTGMTIVVSLEAFVGVLYGCFCGAILYIKVSRIQSHAQVIFSDPIVVRYGTGVMTGDSDTKSADGSADGDSVPEAKEIPCPVLEFRLVNRLNYVQGGELLDATMNIVACIDASQVCKTVQKAPRSRRHGKKGKRGGPRPRGGGAGLLRARSMAALKLQEKNDILSNRLKKTSSIMSLLRSQQELVSRQAQQAFEEDPTGSFVPRKIYSKLEVESPDHPYFKRTWTVCHKLGQYSPLLKASAREAVKNHGGFWPPELNTAEGVRASIQFDQILVSFSGTSNADANSVYAQKVYDFVDMNVGYRFANVLYRDLSDGSVHVDTRLINDVLEQCGGGSENFATKPERRYIDKDSIML